MDTDSASSFVDGRCPACGEPNEDIIADDSSDHGMSTVDDSRQAHSKRNVIAHFRLWSSSISRFGLLALSALTVQSSARLLAWISVLAIAVLSLVPGDQRPHTFLPGKAEHFVAYAAAGFFLAQGYRSLRQRLQGWFAIALASGIFEILQNFVPERSPNAFDALASTSGLTCGLALGAIVTQADAFQKRQ